MQKSISIVTLTISLLFAISALAANKVVVIPLGGATNMYWQGEWTAGTEYKVGHGVQYEGSSYVCIKTHEATVQNLPPEIENWSLLAAKGAAGISPNQTCPDSTVMEGIDALGDIKCKDDLKYVFLTSSTHDGNLGGFAGADNICQDLASNAGLPGIYMAWISTPAGSPATSFSKCRCDYKLPSGDIIANSWQDLTDQDLDSPIIQDETGSKVGAIFEVWTATAPDGTVAIPSAINCSNWTSNNEGDSGIWGLASSTDTQWTDNNLHPCDFLKRLYCFSNKFNGAAAQKI